LVAEGLRNMKNMLNLHLANCNIGKEGARALATSLG